MKRIAILIVLLVAGCQSQIHEPYVSPYGSPFGPRMTQEQLGELTFYMTMELWAQKCLRDSEKEYNLNK